MFVAKSGLGYAAFGKIAMHHAAVKSGRIHLNWEKPHFCSLPFSSEFLVILLEDVCPQGIALRSPSSSRFEAINGILWLALHVQGIFL